MASKKQNKTPKQGKTPAITLTKSTNTNVAKTNKLKKKNSLKKVNSANDNSLLADVAANNNVPNQPKKAVAETYISKKLDLKKQVSNLKPKEKQKAYLNAEKAEVKLQLDEYKSSIELIENMIANKAVYKNVEFKTRLDSQLNAYKTVQAELVKQDQEVDEKLKKLETTSDVNYSPDAKDQDDFNNDTHTLSALKKLVFLRNNNIKIMSEIAADSKFNLVKEVKGIPEERKKLIKEETEKLREAKEQLGAYITNKYKDLDQNALKSEYANKQKELIAMMNFTSRDEAPQWNDKPAGQNSKVNDNRLLLDKWETNRETLLMESAFLRAQQKDWIKQAGGLFNLTQDDINGFNDKEGMAVENLAELQHMYEKMFLIDHYVAEYPMNKAGNDWSTIKSNVEKAYVSSSVQNFNSSVSNVATSLNGKNLVTMNLSHGQEDSSYVTSEITKKLTGKGIIYFEAPYAMNLHENPEKAVGAWVHATSANFPKSTYEVLAKAKDNNWETVPIDSTKVLNGLLDPDVLKKTTLPESKNDSEHLVAQGNVPRQNYMARNVVAHFNNDKFKNYGGLVLIGGAHLANLKGGNLPKMISEERESVTKVTKKIKATEMLKNKVKPEANYDLSKKALKLNGSDESKVKTALKRDKLLSMQQLEKKHKTDTISLIKAAKQEDYARQQGYYID